MRINNKQIKTRNYVAIAAWDRNGAGIHKDKKKEKNKNRCREKVSEGDQ